MNKLVANDEQMSNIIVLVLYKDLDKKNRLVTTKSYEIFRSHYLFQYISNDCHTINEIIILERNTCYKKIFFMDKVSITDFQQTCLFLCTETNARREI